MMFNKFNTQLRNDRAYFLCLMARLYTIPLTVVIATEQILAQEFKTKDAVYDSKIKIEPITIATLKFLCNQNNITVNFDGFVEAIHVDKIHVEKSYQYISEKYGNKDLRIVNTNKSNICFNIPHRQ